MSLIDLFKLSEDQSLKVIAPDNTPVYEEYYHLSFEGLMQSMS
jgi:hypothetical protein